MDTSILETYLKRLSVTCGYADMVTERGEGMLEELSREEREGFARQAEMDFVYQRLAVKFATSTCWNCKNCGDCETGRENRFSIDEPVDIEPWKAFLCNSYEPDFNGLHREMLRLKDIATMLNGFGVPVDHEVVRQYLNRATRHWFDELKLTGHAVPSEIDVCLG